MTADSSGATTTGGRTRNRRGAGGLLRDRTIGSTVPRLARISE
ncbi:hypothetical protein [Dactylosporangium roseum]|nr:hypothetical protein [Dactylosporangium roseum]